MLICASSRRLDIFMSSVKCGHRIGEPRCHAKLKRLAHAIPMGWPAWFSSRRKLKKLAPRSVLFFMYFAK
ncbi:hypothetical protein D3C81_2073940 [compost metagenome]